MNAQRITWSLITAVSSLATAAPVLFFTQQWTLAVTAGASAGLLTLLLGGLCVKGSMGSPQEIVSPETLLPVSPAGLLQAVWDRRESSDGGAIQCRKGAGGRCIVMLHCDLCQSIEGALANGRDPAEAFDALVEIRALFDDFTFDHAVHGTAASAYEFNQVVTKVYQVVEYALDSIPRGGGQ